MSYKLCGRRNSLPGYSYTDNHPLIAAKMVRLAREVGEVYSGEAGVDGGVGPDGCMGGSC